LPALATAQRPDMPVIGFLHSGSPGPFAGLVSAFHQGLGETGFVEGRNIHIEYRWADGDYARLPQLAADLVDRRVMAITSMGGPNTVEAAAVVTKTIPIIFAGGDSVLRTGTVVSLSRPGGNVTGVSIAGGPLLAKALQLLSEIVRKDGPIAVLVDPSYLGVDNDKAAVMAASQQIGREVFFQNATHRPELESAFAAIVERHPVGVAVQGGASFTTERERLIELADRYKLPAIYIWNEFTASGGLMSYGNSLAEVYRQVGNYTGRILHGAKPEELPVMLPSRYRFTINLKTAKALGVSIPPPLLILADDVVE
jgi:putative ABC transport system substrate-binding protein